MNLQQQMEVTRALGFSIGTLQGITARQPSESAAVAEAISRLESAARVIEQEQVAMPDPEPERATGDRCTYTLREQGKAYTRTCEECGLGPCRYGKK